MLVAFWNLLIHDMRLAFRRRSEWLHPVLFFLIVISLFPFAVGPEKSILSSLSGGIIWVAVLLSSWIVMERLFRPDMEDGTMEQLCLSPHSLPLLILAKILAHWLVSAAPLLVATPVAVLWLFFPLEGLGVLLLSLLIGTLTFSFMGAMIVGLTVGLRRSGILLALLTAPLYIPVLIFGSHAVALAASGLGASAPLYMLGALLVLSASLSPFVTAAALRIHVSQ